MIDYVGPSAPHLGSGPLLGLEARNVSAWFGAHKVLERVSLNMQPGRVTALIGPSGCGKSTFLRILNRMHEMVPTAALGGEVLLAGEDIYDGASELPISDGGSGWCSRSRTPSPPCPSTTT